MQGLAVRQFNDKLLRLLLDGGVDFVIVGGTAARPDLGEIQATAEELARSRNLVTDVGDLDVLGELPPIGGYAEAAETAVRFELFR